MNENLLEQLYQKNSECCHKLIKFHVVHESVIPLARWKRSPINPCSSSFFPSLHFFFFKSINDLLHYWYKSFPLWPKVTLNVCIWVCLFICFLPQFCLFLCLCGECVRVSFLSGPLSVSRRFTIYFFKFCVVLQSFKFCTASGGL